MSRKHDKAPESEFEPQRKADEASAAGEGTEARIEALEAEVKVLRSTVDILTELLPTLPGGRALMRKHGWAPAGSGPASS